MSPEKTLENSRITLVIGELGQGGAEKQLVYIARALQELGVDLQCLTLTRGEYYESKLLEIGLHPIWIGRFSNPGIRLLLATKVARKHRPRFFQASHFYTNLYISLLPRIFRQTIGIGSIRGNAFHEVEANGRWAQWLLRAPAYLLANSYTGKANTGHFGVNEKKVFVLPNVIDLDEFDMRAEVAGLTQLPTEECIVATVARLVEVKRLDRFLQALAIARQSVPQIIGWVIGDGPERSRLEQIASRLGLLPDGVCFWGNRTDVASILKRADVFVLTSEREGFPNVLLEAMAACLPIVTTPAGDAAIVVKDGITGVIVSGEQIEQIADRLVFLAQQPAQRTALGLAGRLRVEQNYSFTSLPQALKQLYHQISTTHASS